MRISSEIIMAFVAIILVLLLTFMPHEIQAILINFVESLLNSLIEIFIPSSSIFDTRLLISNLGHLIVFCIAGFVAANLIKIVPVLYIITLLVLLSTGSEISQLFVSGREPSISDLVINISAASAGFLISIQRYKSKRRSSKSSSSTDR